MLQTRPPRDHARAQVKDGRRSEAVPDEVSRRKAVIEAGATDYERWSDPRNLEAAWNARAARAAQLFVPEGSTVLDLGCGAMALESFLPPGCAYLPCDLVARDARTQVCDFNRGEMPEARGADLVTLLGVLEYVHDLPAFLGRLRGCNLPLVLSYCPTDMAHLDRRALGWVNDLTVQDLARHLVEAGFEPSVVEVVDAVQVMLRATPGRLPRARRPRVAVLSYSNVPNFGDRLGYHLIHDVLPAHADVRHVHFNPWDAPDEEFDLLVLGIGNSVFGKMLGDRLLALMDRCRYTVGLFGTQHRDVQEEAPLHAVLDRLTVWFARYEDDVRRYGRGRSNVVHVGDWMINAFPMAEAWRDETLTVDDWIWQDLPLDRTIQRIQEYRRVVSYRVHPLLCALTSAREAAYVEQRHEESGSVSGKFRSLLLDVFGRSFDEDAFFPVDRDAVAAYKAKVRRMTDEMRRIMGMVLGEAP